MRRWIPMVAVALFCAGAAAADPPSIPSPDVSADWENVANRVDEKMDSALDGKTDAALRHHKVAAEAGRDAAGCNHVIATPEAKALSASERHRRLTACLVQLRTRDEMLAGQQP